MASMSNLPLIVAGAIATLWITLFAAAAFVDRTLESLASNATPLALLAVGFLLSTETVKLFRDKDKDER